MADAFEQRALLAAESLLIDHWTAEVVLRLHAIGVQPLLLKGPATARWLYADDPAARDYADIDLLVAPDSYRPTEAVLEELGFARPEGFWLDGDLRPHDAEWRRESDGAVVDLHRTIHSGELLPDELVWSVLSRDAPTLDVGGVAVHVLTLAGRALHVVLHLGDEKPVGSKPWADLERALTVVPPELWDDAAALARELGLEAEMGHKLRRQPRGADVADRLGLPRERTAHTAFMESGSLRRFVGNLKAQKGGRAKVTYAVRKLFPPLVYLRRTTSLADRGPLGVIAAYAARLGKAAGSVPSAVRVWRRG